MRSLPRLLLAAFLGSCGEGLSGPSTCPMGQVPLAGGGCGEPCEGNAIRGDDGQCHECGALETVFDNRCVCRPGYIKSGGVCLPGGGGVGGLGSDWHPDPDGDGVASADDRCPHAYDPTQGDADGDGLGDACDDDFAPPDDNGPVTDLHAEHVTPYGGWFSFTSPKSDQFGWHAVIAWSQNRADLDGSFASLRDGGRGMNVERYARYGIPIERSLIVITMDPGATYYVAVRMGSDGTGELGNVLEIHTADAPLAAMMDVHPRAVASPASIMAMKDRQAMGDASLAGWIDMIGSRALSADETGHEIWCVDDALLFAVTGDTAYRDKAIERLGELMTYWESNDLDTNNYRWADAALGQCLDLLWDEVDQTTRNRAVAAFLPDDEFNLIGEPSRLDDSDQSFSDTRTGLIDGIVACGASGIDAALADRGCDVLDAALRRFYGVVAPITRRDREFLGQSGGNMPDSAFYQSGTSRYVYQAIWAVQNAGEPQGEFAGFMLNSVLGQQIYSITPRLAGRAPYGDVESFEANPEVGSAPISPTGMDTGAYQLGYLRAAGFTDGATWAKWIMGNVYEIESVYADMFPMLIHDGDDVTAADPRATLPTAYWDSGLGIFYDRTSWDADASYFMVQATWQAVDHMHEDAGNFQLYRKGRWITREALGYDGPVSDADGHNVMMLDNIFSDGTHPGQYRSTSSGPARYLRLSAGGAHAFAVVDLTGPYTSGKNWSWLYDRVQRSLVWLKTDQGAAPDVVVIYDLVVNAAGEDPQRRWQLHFDETPQIAGTRAQVTLGDQRADVAIVAPGSASLSTIAPVGSPGDYPGTVYTHRLSVDPGVSDAELRFVAVLQATDATAAPFSSPIEIGSGSTIGALVGNEVVLFPRAPVTGLPPAPAGDEVTFTASLPLRIWWTGLAPATDYALEVSDASGTVTVTLSPGSGLTTDSAGLLGALVDATGNVEPIYAP